MRGHISRGGGAAPQHRITPLAHKPHPSPDDASGADCIHVKFKLRLAPQIFEFKITCGATLAIKFIAKFKILWYPALYFAKIPIKF